MKSLVLLTVCCLSWVSARAAGPCCPHHGVAWPALEALGTVALKVDASLQGGQADRSGLVAEVQQVVTAASQSKMPKDAKRPLEVKFLLGDLERFARRLGDQPEQLRGFHDRVDTLLNLAGVGHHHPEEKQDQEHDAEPAGDVAPDHDHDHGLNEGPHHGWMIALQTDEGYQSARVELKLHDDAGDLEAWLTTPGGAPLLLPLDTRLTVQFPELDGREVVLQVRDRTHNRDESGTPRVKDARTDYLVFPGTTGADADWLKGKAFHQPARIVLSAKGWSSQVFHLVPHVH